MVHLPDVCRTCLDERTKYSPFYTFLKDFFTPENLPIFRVISERIPAQTRGELVFVIRPDPGTTCQLFRRRIFVRSLSDDVGMTTQC